MNTLLTNQARQEQTCREIELLQAELGEWLARRRQTDARRQYSTQLNALEQTLTGNLARERTEIQNIPLDQDMCAFYAACRLHDKRLILLRRVWNYYRSKFDQRDDPRLGPVLLAADEIVWSCYAGAFANANAALPAGAQPFLRGSAPLPYVEPWYSPQANPRQDLPPDWRSEADSAFIAAAVQAMPIPTVSLPPICVTAPWWLIFLGHETGHHVQYDLLPDEGMLAEFRQALEGALPGEDAAGKRWGGWGIEIFADLFGIAMVGPWAAWAMNDLLLSDARTMLTWAISARSGYPAPAVRVALLREVARRLMAGDDPGLLAAVTAADVPGLEGLQAQAALAALTAPAGPDGLDALRQQDTTDNQQVAAVAAALLGHRLAGVCTFRQLGGWDSAVFARGGRVSDWATALCQNSAPDPETSLPAARRIIAGAVEAWAGLASLGDPVRRADGQSRLAEHLLPVLRDSREAGERALVAVRLPDLDAAADAMSHLVAVAAQELPG